MRRQIVYLPAVRHDFVEALNYYDTLSPKLGNTFRDEFRRAEQSIEAGFVTHKVVFQHYHRVLFRRYPYTLYYRVTDGRAVIVGLLYSRLAPETVKSALTFRTP